MEATLEDCIESVERFRGDLSAVVEMDGEKRPYKEKREAAAQELKRTYETSPFYSQRYAAGILLRIDEDKLNEQMNSWLDSGRLSEYDAKIVFDIATTRPLREKAARIAGVCRMEMLCNEMSYALTLTTDELKEIYRNAPNQREKDRAAYRLGYSEYDLFILGHPVITKVAEAAAGAAAFAGLLYLVIHHINK